MRNNKIYEVYCRYNRLAAEWDKAKGNIKERARIARITDKLVVIMDAFEGR